MSISDQIHSRALEIALRYKRAEAELIEILQQAEEHRVFLKRGHSSLFKYVVSELGLSENFAYSLITVARKAREIPELKSRLREGALTLSNARRVATVLTVQNKEEWIRKASELSNRQLEREIVKICPKEATPERASYVAEDRVKLELGLSEREMLKLRRVQDLLSQSRKHPVSLEEAIGVLTSEFLEKNDPVEKAKRHYMKKGPSASVGKLVTLRVERKREPLSAAVTHQVNFRDERRCVYILPDGSRCNQSRWIEIHHKKPVCHGGDNRLENLVTLCSAHHKFQHLRDGP